MQTSSPLAAMHPQAITFGHGHWHVGMDRPTSNPSSLPFGYRNFNFRDLSMERKQSDYFSSHHSLGASPTANLAVDLGQNFHIDKSPQPPTPRRSLFSTAVWGNISCRESLVTPPPPSSSPPPESMDISPLPHKAPFSTQIQIQSPTPEPTPSTGYDESMLSSPAVVPESPLEPLRTIQLPERRKPTMLRPPLSRAKGLSTTAISTKSTTSLNSQCQPFLFGSKVAPSSAPLTLDECFTESPQQGFVPGSLASPIGAPRPKSASQKSSFFAQPTGSPSASHTRNPSAPYQRRRKAIRRSLSMVDKPADVFNQQPQEERDCGLHSIMDVDEAPQLALPHFMQDNDSIPRISKETMIEVLDGKFGDRFDHSMVVDCRFEYEYKGGHIDGAMNFNDKEELAHKLFQQTSPNKTLLIFHCEYSEFRAPMAAAYIRCQDRNANTHQYPKLTYPEVYILSGGYSSFFNDYKSRCYPQNYVEMKDKEHYNACERGLGRIKQQRNKLSRAQTFAFGQRSEPDDSPTAMGRQCTNVMARMDPMSLEQCVDASKRINARRQASF